MLKGKTVIVTGVGGGLGRECVEAALREGANVVMAARTKETLSAIENELGSERLTSLSADITDADACAELVSLARATFGRVDGLVQVAAYENAWGGLWDFKPDEWRTAYDTNVLGALTLIRPVATAMKEGGGGSIVLIGSQSQYIPQLPQAGYAASKGALLTTMYYLAHELGPSNIRCNMVVPSWMWGPPVQMLVDYNASTKNITKEEAINEIVGDFPLRRMTEDGEVADVAMFFTSDHAKAVTGQHLLVNSGEMFS
ncbi:SDR family oxidoreductase [Actinocorallia longicatena]|uniref:SDR family oxidoreductase n=1 Tax=Actinocorallia longicatena TaxID=111803 RepID=A0ABP6QHK0_9ACTN